VATGDFADLKNRAIYLARFASGSTVDLTRAGQLLNEAALLIADSGPRWEFLVEEGTWSTVADQQDYTYAALATDMGGSAIKEIYGMTNQTHSVGRLTNMSWTSLEEISQSSNDSDPTGASVGYAVFGETVRMHPTPSSVQTIKMLYLGSETEMSADADVPAIPLGHRFSTLVTYAASKLCVQRGGGESIALAGQLMNQYQEGYAYLEQRYAAARMPQLALDDPNWNNDLPGAVAGYNTDYELY